MECFGISGVEPPGSAPRELLTLLDLREICCEDGRWMKLSRNCILLLTLAQTVLNLRVLQPENLSVKSVAK